jgi:putative ABC transport system ATP-binding protein
MSTSEPTKPTIEPTAPNGVLIQTRDLARHYQTPAAVVRALDGVSLEIREREVVALVGASGSGKSTLLNLLGGLDQPTTGALLFRGQDMAGFDSRALASYRRQEVGMVFQSFNLISHRTAFDNVLLPMIFAGLGKAERRERAAQLLNSVGLGARMQHRPAELSGGEQQRVAIARAMANSPQLLLADEPTGNLDSKTAAEILELLVRLNREQNKTLVLITHDEQVAALASRRIRLRDGKIVAVES